MDLDKYNKMQMDGYIENTSLNLVNDEIDKCGAHVIVLDGGRGSGKTTILLSRAITKVNGKVSLYVHFNDDLIDAKEDAKENYYGLLLANEMATHIINDGESNYQVTKTMNKNNYSYHIGELTEELIKHIKKTEDVTSLELLVDRFDWINGSSKESQRAIERYFDMFDKVILTNDDEEYNSKYKRIFTNYNKDSYLIYQILYRMMMVEEYPLWMDRIVRNNMKSLIEGTNGDIDKIKLIISNIRANKVNDLDFAIKVLETNGTYEVEDELFKVNRNKEKRKTKFNI